MKINDKMRFPHPVLSKHSEDYIEGEFFAEFSYQSTDDNQLEITSTFTIDDEKLKALIHNQRAGIGYFLICRPTYYNYLQSASLGEFKKYFDLSLLHGEITVRPTIWALKDIINFQSTNIHEEFGGSVNIRKGSIIAIGPEFRFSVDPKKFKPFESIFNLSINDDIQKGMIEVDADQAKIAILAEKGTHEKIANMRSSSEGRSILLSAVYMPVIAEIVGRLQRGDKNLESHRWYKVFAAKCADLGIQPDNETETPLNVAQQLLNAPLERTFEAQSTNL